MSLPTPCRSLGINHFSKSAFNEFKAQRDLRVVCIRTLEGLLLFWKGGSGLEYKRSTVWETLKKWKPHSPCNVGCELQHLGWCCTARPCWPAAISYHQQKGEAKITNKQAGEIEELQGSPPHFTRLQPRRNAGGAELCCRAHQAPQQSR